METSPQVSNQHSLRTSEATTTTSVLPADSTTQMDLSQASIEKTLPDNTPELSTKAATKSMKELFQSVAEVIPESYRLVRQADPSIMRWRVATTVGQSLQYLVYGGLISSVIANSSAAVVSTASIVAPLIGAYLFKCGLDIMQGHAQNAEGVQQAKIEACIQEKLRALAPKSLERLNRPGISQDYGVVCWGGIWAFTGANTQIVQGIGTASSMVIAVGFALTHAPVLVTGALILNAFFHGYKTYKLMQLAMNTEEQTAQLKTKASQFSWKRTWPHFARLYRNLGITEIIDRKVIEKREEVISVERNLAKIKNAYHTAGSCLSAVTGAVSFGALVSQIRAPINPVSPENAVFVGLTMIPIFLSSLESLGKGLIDIAKGKTPLDAMKRLQRARAEEEAQETGAQIDWNRYEGARLTISDLHFAYPNVDSSIRPMPVIRGLTVDIEPGSLVAIVGDNGAGKSTLVQLLDRSYHALCGSIAINSQNINQVEDGELFRGLKSLPQDAPQVDGSSIREFFNWARTASGQQLDEDLLRKILDVTGFTDILESGFIREDGTQAQEFPDGLDTILGANEGGKNLSGGQRSILYIAYMLYSQAKILCFDEPERAVAEKRQAQFFQTLTNFKSLFGYQPTIILVTHRKESLAGVDKVLYLKKGIEGAAGFGTHQELLVNSADYRDFWAHSSDESKSG